MKVITFFLFSLSLLTACNNYKKIDYWELLKTDVERDELHGHVKSVIDSTFAIKMSFGEIIVDSLESTSQFTYDKQGNALKSILPWGNYSYSYENFESKEVTIIEMDGQKYRRKEMTLNPSKLPIRIDLFGEKGILESRIDYKYNKLNQIEGMVSYGSDGKIEFQLEKFTYNEKKQPQSYVKVYNEWQLPCKYEFKYNTWDNLEEEIYYEANKDEDWIIRKRTVHIYANANTRTNVTIFNYDDDGDLDGKMCYSSFNQDGWWTKLIEYDEDDKLIKETTRQIELDKQGNYTKIIYYENNRAVKMHTRQIEYH